MSLFGSYHDDSSTQKRNFFWIKQKALSLDPSAKLQCDKPPVEAVLSIRGLQRKLLRWRDDFKYEQFGMPQHQHRPTPRKIGTIESQAAFVFLLSFLPSESTPNVLKLMAYILYVERNKQQSGALRGNNWLCVVTIGITSFVMSRICLDYPS